MEPRKKPTSETVKKPSVRFAQSFTSSKGKVFYAADYGHKAWPIPVRSGSLRRAMKVGRR